MLSTSIELDAPASCYRGIWATLRATALGAMALVNPLIFMSGVLCLDHKPEGIKICQETFSGWPLVVIVVQVAATAAAYLFIGAYRRTGISLAAATLLLISNCILVFYHIDSALSQSSVHLVTLLVHGAILTLLVAVYVRGLWLGRRLYREAASSLAGVPFPQVVDKVLRRSRLRFGVKYELRWSSLLFGVGAIFVAAIIVLAIFAMLGVLALVFISNDLQFTDALFFMLLLGIAATLPLGILASFLYRAAKRRVRTGAATILQHDTRPPILLLRSFVDDHARVPRNGLLASLLRRRFRLEEVMAACLSTIGPCVAIGKPGEKLPLLGSYKFYFEGDHWQSEVGRMIGTSQLIAMVVGETAWLKWELEQIIMQQALPRLILIFPPGNAEERLRRWQNISTCFSDTDHGRALMQIDLATVLCIMPQQDGNVLSCHGERFDQVEYDIGLLASISTILDRHGFDQVNGPPSLGKDASMLAC